MLWIKRNLFLAIGGLVTIVLLGAGVLYLWGSIQEKDKIEEELAEAKGKLDNISRKDPYPSQANITLVNSEITRLRESIAKMRAHFTPVPAQRVTGKDFADLLANTLDELRRKAAQLSIQIPDKKYAFSFEAQKDKLRFAPGGFPALPEQLAEVKTITQVLFDAKINKLVNIRRSPASADDEQFRGSSDYLEQRASTNFITGALCRPYQFEFECFSTELAHVLEKLATGKYALHVKSVLAEPAVAATAPGALTPTATPLTPMPMIPGRTNFMRRGMPPVRQPNAPGAAAGAAAGAAGELKTVLAERLLKVALYIEVIQPPPGK